MQHCADTFAVYNTIRSTYVNNEKETFTILTKQELPGSDDLPRNKPDLYLRGSKSYFIMFVHDIQPFLAKKLLATYIDHSEEGWDEEDIYPGLLFICRDIRQENRLIINAKNILEDMGIDEEELSIGVTTMKALLVKPHIKDVWKFIDKKRPVSLL